mgnify:CR=1 FL=1
MKDLWFGAIAGFLIGAGLVVVITVGCREAAAERNRREGAKLVCDRLAKEGVGRYVFDPETGETAFEFVSDRDPGIECVFSRTVVPIRLKKIRSK